MGMRAYDSMESGQAAREESRLIYRLRSGAYWNSMKRSRVFWQLVMIHFLGCLGHIIVVTYIVPIAIHNGIEPLTAAGILSVLLTVSTLSQFGGPVLADRLDGRLVMAAILIFQGGPVLLLFWANETWQL